MKTTTIKIEYPDHFTNNEIVNAIMSQIDIKSLNELGITIYAPKEFSWFN